MQKTRLFKKNRNRKISHFLKWKMIKKKNYKKRPRKNYEIFKNRAAVIGISNSYISSK